MNQTGFSGMNVNDLNDGIAIIGMAGRFPGADGIAALWDALLDRRDLIARTGEKQHSGAGGRWINAYGRLDGIDLFDAQLFAMPRREAEATDPQHRIFLETCWMALEDSGYCPDGYPGVIGVYAGAGMGQYLYNLVTARHMQDAIDPFQIKLGNDKDFLATRVSYKLNLKGPSQTVQTACSSSLMAVHEACIALQTYQCDIALAGGVALDLEQNGYTYQQGGILSPDGRCRPFDALAQGTVPGSGVGVVVLKRVAEAIQDRDAIYAVILGTSSNNDGGQKVGFTAPSVQGQRNVILSALEVAGVTADQVGYVEAHGTGTALGDPTEIEALTQAFHHHTQASSYCRIGALKANIGHLDVAAGVAGLIKTALMLHHKRVVPQIHFNEPNRLIPFETTPFKIDTTGGPWENSPRIAGVSSFGIGGTNVHAVLSEVPRLDDATPGEEGDSYLIPLSVHHPETWGDYCSTLANFIERPAAAPLRDIAFTLQQGRRAQPYRHYVVASDKAELAAELRRIGLQQAGSPVQNKQTFKQALLLPGQGGQFIDYGIAAYCAWPAFRSEVDACLDAFPDEAARTVLRNVFLGKRQVDEACLDELGLGQSVLFIVEYALARCWELVAGLADVLVGHSLGEYVAACLAGTMSLVDTLRLVSARGRLTRELCDGGAMLAASLHIGDLRKILPTALDVAVVNADDRIVVSGTFEEVTRFRSQLEALGVESIWVNKRFAFHSRQMQAMADAFAIELATVSFQPASRPFASCVDGAIVGVGQTPDADYWIRHLLKPVRFADMLESTLAAGIGALVNTGPGNAISRLSSRYLRGAPQYDKVAEISVFAQDAAPQRAFLHALGQAWQAGARIDFDKLRIPGAGRCHLPARPMYRERFWIDRETLATQAEAPQPSTATSEESTNERDIGKFMYQLRWQSSDVSCSDEPAPRQWLVFPDQGRSLQALTSRLEASGHVVGYIENVGQAPAWAHFADAANLRMLLKDFAIDLRQPLGVVFAHLLDPIGAMVLESAYRGIVDPVVAVTTGLAKCGFQRVDVTVLASGLDVVWPDDRIDARKALITGPVRSLAAELQGYRCQMIDIDADSLDSPALLEQVLNSAGGVTVAFRRGSRWEQAWTRMSRTAPFELPAAKNGNRPVYLITGGLGGIGIALAIALARLGQAHFVLTSRSAAERGQADRTLDAHFRVIEECGSTYEVHSVDVVDESGLARLRDAVLARHGAIDGIVHCAGMPAGGLLSHRRADSAFAQIAAKCQGAENVERVFGGCNVSFVVYCSSIASELGGIGQADYSAANAYLNALAVERQRANPGTRYLSILWDTWAEAGMATLPPVNPLLKRVFDDARRKGLSTSEGQHVFARALGMPNATRVLATRTPWPERLKAAQAVTLQSVMRELADMSENPIAGLGEYELLHDRTVSELIEMRLPAAEDTRVFAVRLSTERLSWLADHLVAGVPVLPAVAYLEMLAAAARLGFPDGRTIRIHRLEIGAALQVPSDKVVVARLVLHQAKEGSRWLASIESLDRTTWSPHAHATVEFGGPAPAAVRPAAEQEQGETVHMRELYDRTMVRGYFRTIDTLVVHPSRVTAFLASPAAERRQLFNIAMLDGAVQSLVYLAVRRAASSAQTSTYLPFAFEDVILHQPITRNAVADTSWIAGAWGEDPVLCGKLDVTDTEGRLLISVGKVYLKEMRAAVGSARKTAATSIAAPCAGTEEKVAVLFESLLGAPVASRDDNFFELGADSLLAIRLLARIRDEFQIEINLVDAFAQPTVAGIAALIDRSAGTVGAASTAIPVLERTDKTIFDLLALVQAEGEGHFVNG